MQFLKLGAFFSSITLLMILDNFQVSAMEVKQGRVTTVNVNSNKVIYRQRSITEVLHPNWNRVCNLTSDEMNKICGECAEVYASVYGSHKYTMLSNDDEVKPCGRRSINFGTAINNSDIDMWIRECPTDPAFYISEGNKKGWVFVYIPSRNSSSNGDAVDKQQKQQLQFVVHLGVFDELKTK